MTKIRFTHFFMLIVSVFMLSACFDETPSSLPSLSAPSSLPAGITLIEKVTQTSDKVMIPYSKYRLENGLTVILSPDNSDPLVHVDVTYHVGSAREELGKSGFAHFFEHMMFQGSKHVADQEHFRIITEAGGTLNGTTNRDRTNYYETIPANQLEKVLWLESDRMGFLLEAVSQKKFEIQRDTVKNERAQNYDNRPYGLIWEKMGEIIYPEGHPYSWQPIGYVEDLNRVDVNDLKAFFLRWYGPNNAVLTIGGDIDINQTLTWINKYFGSFPIGAEVQDAPKRPVTLENDRFITLEDRIQQPMVVMGWPTEYRGAETQTALDILANILGNGTNSLLYQDLVKTQKSVDAGAFHDCAELSCTFYIYAMAPSGEKGLLSPLYQDILKTLERFNQEGVAQDRLDQIIGMKEANSIFALQSVAGKVGLLAFNETFYGQPDRLEDQLEKIRNVSPESVKQVYTQFLAENHKAVLSVVPKNKTKFAVQTANVVTPERTLPEYTKVTDEEINTLSIQDDFDRSVMPQVAQAVHAEMPVLYRHQFDNGVELLGTNTAETPTVLIRISLASGERYEPQGKEGLARLTALLLQEGTLTRSGEEIEAQLDKLGSTISISSNIDSTDIVVSSLKWAVDETLDVIKEILFEPAFNQDDFERLKQQMIEEVIYQSQRPSWLASRATQQVLFDGTVFARPGEGTVASLTALTLDDVQYFYETYYAPNHSHIVVVGDVSEDAIQKSLAFYTQWQKESPQLLSFPAMKLPTLEPIQKGQKIIVVDKPDAPQSVIRFVRQGLPVDAVGEQFLTKLANFNLAGNFNSRINQNLREDKGYTYGANGYLMYNRDIGSIVFNTQVRADVTVDSIIEIQKEMETFSQSGLSDLEIEFMRLAVGQQDALSYETPAQKSQLLSQILTYNLADNYLQQRNKMVATVSKKSLNDIAAKWLSPKDYQIIVVGDAKSLTPKLETLGIPIEGLEITH